MNFIKLNPKPRATDADLAFCVKNIIEEAKKPQVPFVPSIIIVDDWAEKKTKYNNGRAKKTVPTHHPSKPDSK